MKKEKEIVFLRNKKGKLSFNVFIFLVLILAIFLYLILKTTKFEQFSFLKNFIDLHINFFENLLIVLIIFISTYFFTNFTKKIIKRYLINLGKSKKHIKLFLNVYGYLVWIILIFLTFSLIFKQVGSLITSIGLIGFGLTLALQKPILNFVGWVVIISGQTYHLGDVISINNTTGKVYDIGVMHTSISELNPDGDSTGKSIIIPNEFVFIYSVANFSKGTDYVWDDMVINLTYKSNWKKAIKIIEKTVQEYYNKNIKKEIKETFKNNFKEYEKIIVRFGMDEKGLYVKTRYMVNFNKSNEVKRELTKILLSKLKTRDIFLGKVENVA